jgi:hypothetical protein
LRLFGLGWFLNACTITVKKYNAKVHFYHKFMMSMGLWFLGLPIMAIASAAITPWTRFVVINALDWTFLFVFQSVLCYMYNPEGKLNKNFPFHATTTETLKGSRHGRTVRRRADLERIVASPGLRQHPHRQGWRHGRFREG